MSINIIRRVTGYLAVPAVAAGILGGAAVGMATVATADTGDCYKCHTSDPAQPAGTINLKGKAKGIVVDPAEVNSDLIVASDPADINLNSKGVLVSDPADINLNSKGVLVAPAEVNGNAVVASDPAAKPGASQAFRAEPSQPAGTEAGTSQAAKGKAVVAGQPASTSDAASTK